METKEQQVGVQRISPLLQDATTQPKCQTEPRPPLCKHWARSKVCLYHAKGKCKFDHPPDYEIPPTKQQSSSRRRTKSNQTDLSDRHRSVGGRLQTRNDARVAILRAFLADELARNGIPDLSGFRVLDVAGGKGELAFQLLNLNNVSSCHVIDPRPLSLGRFRKRLSRGFYHRSQGILQNDVVRPQSEPERPVDQLRCFYSSELWEEETETDTAEGRNNTAEETKEKNDNNDNDNDDNREQHNSKKYQKQRQKFFENCYKAKGWVWPPKGSDNEHASCGKNYEDRDETQCYNTTTTKKQAPNSNSDSDSNSDPLPLANLSLQESTKAASSLGIDFDNASSIVKTADLVVGMHPDQAVDAIVDSALYQNISFFVIPCCTYSREFPHRRVQQVSCVPVSENKTKTIEDKNKFGNGFRTMGRVTTMKLVTTYEDLIEYLLAKSPDIKKRVLPFEGRNICLYRVVPPKTSQEEKAVD